MTNPISPEQRLFVGVIVNAALEAAGAQRSGVNHEAVQADARAWFAEGDSDFTFVCTLAGFEPNTVRSRVLAYLDRIEADPTAAITVRRARGRMAQESGLTMKHVAKKAGVSPHTVARALNGTGPCAPYTRARIIEAAQAIGYPIRSTARVH